MKIQKKKKIFFFGGGSGRFGGGAVGLGVRVDGKGEITRKRKKNTG